ncbi:MAG TPA: beta-N-acetylhexosaminidase [Microlunatus sp.]|nr:beta-N-acetylhexosaminidase [Microlunatus sp.]
MLLPQPRSVTYDQGRFTVAETDTVDGPPELAAVVRRLLSPGTGLELPIGPGGRIRIDVDRTLPPEGYRLNVTPASLTIEAADATGVGWAVQTLRQLLPPATLLPGSRVRPLHVPAVRIEDAPRFAWRGLHLDTGRHFAPVSDLFRFVDLLALHKFNVFHLHLTDDQGWRFESRRHPRLQEVASWRRETRRPSEETGDGTPHGGFYRQDQLRALVNYAAERGITVVPELEFPGHARALLAAYPELGNHPEAPQAAATTFGIFDEVLNLDDDAMDLVFDLYEELLDVFPSRYVHIGGDECPRVEWLQSPRAAELAAHRGLTDPAQLQRWFTEQLRQWLAHRGRVAVGWDEIIDQGPLPGAVAMAWRGAAIGVRAAEQGMDVVMAPTSRTYFDYYGGDNADEPYRIGGLLTTPTVYAFDPLEDVPAEVSDRILGVQGQLWTEYLPTPRDVDYAAFPRACALAEVAWSDPQGRSWSEFEPRLAAHLERLDVLGVNYRPEEGPRSWQRGGTGHLARVAGQPDPSPEAHDA